MVRAWKLFRIREESRIPIMQFKKLRLIEPLRRAIRSEGYITPTPIQVKAIPHVLEGKDILGCAQTGTGKTAAFALPILQRLHDRVDGSRSGENRHGKAHSRRLIRAMVLAPTRELAAQIGESFQAYGRHTGLRHTVIFGGVKQDRQTRAISKGVDIIVATPGRLLDLLNQKLLCLRNVEICVLDEADRMLDMGFIDDIRRVFAHLPSERQTLLFSATMPRQIRTLAETILNKPIMVKTESTGSVAVDTVEQAMYYVESTRKVTLLEELLKDPQVTRALVFTRTKRRADRVASCLNRSVITAKAFHSNKSQSVRMRTLADFKRGVTRVLVASDIAARGIDVDDISHVFNFDLPTEAETYVHRIGRTGRAGASGQAVSFCSEEERNVLRNIERLLGEAIPVLGHSIAPASPQWASRSGQMKSGTSRKKHVPAGGNRFTRTRRRPSSSEQSDNRVRRRRRSARVS